MKKITFGQISPNFAENSLHIKATGTIGSFGPPKAIQNVEDDSEGEKVKEVMGISTFGKRAKTFDIQDMIAQVKATAKELRLGKEELELENPSEDSTSDDEDDLIGPPVPQEVIEKEDSDDKEDETNDTGDYFIPISNETEMVHGTKAITAISVDPSGARLASGKVF